MRLIARENVNGKVGKARKIYRNLTYVKFVSQ